MLPIDHLRRDYSAEPLEKTDVDPDPVLQFAQWMDEALKAELPEPNATVLATVDEEGRPSARVVLLKGFDPEGFVFYTNYESRKAKEMEASGHAALCFNWLELQRQVRIEGAVERVAPATSTEYFQSRPRESQLGAWASPQSSVIPDRAVLEANMQALRERFDGQPVLPRPPQWGGYRLRPRRLEFWQGRSSRLHDRIQYRYDARGGWIIERLAP